METCLLNTNGLVASASDLYKFELGNISFFDFSRKGGINETSTHVILNKYPAMVDTYSKLDSQYTIPNS